MSRTEGERYNVVYVVIDCLRASNLGCYGHNSPTSPNIDTLADSGVLFEEAYCSTNHTDPSFTSMMSGRYPLSNGIIHHGFDIEDEEIKALDTTNTIFLPEILNSIGYATYGMSDLHRWHKRGFDFYGDKPEMLANESADSQLFQRSLESVKSTVRNLKPYLPNTVYDFLEHIGTQTGIVTPSGDAADLVDMTIDLLRRDKPDDFFCLLHFNDAHYPYELPEDLFEPFDLTPEAEKTPIEEMLAELPESGWRRRTEKINLRGVEYVEDIPAYYDAGIRYIDRELSRLMSHLESRDQLEETIFVVTGDHGDNVLWRDTFIGHHGLYDPVAHIPLILSGGPFTSGSRLDGFVQHLDLVPTLLETLGVNPGPYGFDGKDMTEFIHDEQSGFRQEVYVMDPMSPDRFAIKDDDYKLICSLQGDEPFLADLSGQSTRELYASDGDENENLAAEHPDIVEAYHERLAAFVEEQRTKRCQRRTFTTRVREEGIYASPAEQEGAVADRLSNGLDLLSMETESAVIQAALTNATFMTEGSGVDTAEDESDEQEVEKRLRNLGYIE